MKPIYKQAKSISAIRVIRGQTSSPNFLTADYADSADIEMLEKPSVLSAQSAVKFFQMHQRSNFPF